MLLRLLLATVAVAAPQPTLASFVGTWYGHTRDLVVARDGTARESVGDGCCHPIVDLTLRLSHPRHVAGGLAVSVTVTAVRLHDRGAFRPGHRPHPGETGTIRLRRHVLTESVSGADYCGVGAKPVCGA